MGVGKVAHVNLFKLTNTPTNLIPLFLKLLTPAKHVHHVQVDSIHYLLYHFKVEFVLICPQTVLKIVHIIYYMFIMFKFKVKL